MSDFVCLHEKIAVKNKWLNANYFFLQFDKKIIIIFLDMKIYITEDDMCTTQKLNLARVHKWFEANNCRHSKNVDAADKILVMTCNGFSLLEEIL